MASNIPAAAQQQLITDPPTSNENAENQYFYEDEVFKFDSNGRVKFGLIMGTYEAGASDTEQSDFEDNIKQGEIRVAWHPKGTEEITEEKYVSNWVSFTHIYTLTPHCILQSFQKILEYNH